MYVGDTGLRNVISFRFSQDLGRLAENVVAQKLFQECDDLFYFGNGSECDFICKQKGQFYPLQVTYADLADEKIKNRELRGIIAAMRSLKVSEGKILTDNLEGEEKIENYHVFYQPIWKFLLQ